MAEHWLVWPGKRLVGLQVTLTDATADNCDWGEFELNVPPVHPVIHNTPEKSRQSAALRSMVSPPLFISNLAR
jgi:hypothetical protein